MSNSEYRKEIIRELEELKEQMERTLSEFVDKVTEAKEEELGFDIHLPNLDAYVFAQISEHIDNANPYNQSLASIIDDLAQQDEGLELYDEEEDDEEE